MPKPSPLRLPCARWLGRLASMMRSLASYDCLMMLQFANAPSKVIVTETKVFAWVSTPQCI